MDWKDTLLPGSTRENLPWDGTLLPGWVLDNYGPPIERNDWVMGPNGTPVISGSSEQQGYGTPSPGFLPVDAGIYGGQTFEGRTNDLYSKLLSVGAPRDLPTAAPPAPTGDDLVAFKKQLLRKKAIRPNAPTLSIAS